MKKFLFLMLFVFLGFSAVQSATTSMRVAPDFIIIDNVVTLTANVYMNAQYVKVELLDGNGRVQASATVAAGSNVSLTMNDATRKLRSTYHINDGLEYLVIEDAILL